MSGVKVMFRLTFVFQLNYPSAFTEFTLQPTPESPTAQPQTHKARKPTTSSLSDLFTSLRRCHRTQSSFCLCLSPPCCQRQMYGRKACQLVKELASAEKGQLTPCNSDLFDQVVAECSQHHLELQSLIRKIQEEGLDVQTTRNPDHFGALIHHLSLVRNKRCLVAYVYNRAEIVRSLIWKVGPVLPQEIQEKLSHTEEDYFKKHSTALQAYMSRLDLDLTVDMVPPKDPYIQVRVLDEVGVVLSDDKTTNFARHSMHFLKRTDAEQFISRGLMEELKG